MLDQWDAATATRRVVGLAGADAHARLGFRQQTDPFEEGWHLKVPSYEASFKAFSLRVLLDAPLSGDAVRDADNLLTHVRWGRTYTVIDGLASPGGFEFTATSGDRPPASATISTSPARWSCTPAWPRRRARGWSS